MFLLLELSAHGKDVILKQQSICRISAYLILICGCANSLAILFAVGLALNLD